MKAILCGYCNDFKALRPHNPVSCSCGNVQGWWVDSKKGIAKVYAKDKKVTRIMGFHNGFLKFAYEFDDAPKDSEWKKLTELVCEISEGYLFHKDKRNCPFVIINIGDTSDVSWSDVPYLAEENKTNNPFNGEM